MNFLKNLKIGPRLALAFGSVLVMMLVIAAVGLSGISTVNAGLKSMYEDRAVPLAQLSEVEYIFVRNRVLIMDILARPEAANIEKRSAELKTNIARASELIKAYTGTEMTSEEKGLADDFTQKRIDYNNKGLLPIRDAVAAGKMDEAQKIYLDVVSAGAPAIEKIITRLVKIQVEASQALYESANHTKTTANTTAIVVSLLALLVGAGLAWAITVSITGPVNQAVDLAETVAAGDLTRSVHVEGKDEVATLLRALGAMTESLVKIVAQVRASSDSIATGSAEIATGNADLSQRTEEQASSLEETAASMEQMNATVKQNADTAQMATQLATSASGVAAKGGAVVAQVITTMEDITASSRKINDIIGVIDGIAFQTNILALNAAVEAARAGEQGRGFAVVAGEVRTLAQRSAQAAKEIKALIGQSVEKVDAGSRLVGEAGTTMDEIVAQVKRVADLIGEIGAATREQTVGIGQVSEAVTQLDRVTQQNAALVEESAAAAESLKQQAARMTQVVGVFKLDASAARSVASAAPAPTYKAPAYKAPAAKPVAKASLKPATASPIPVASSAASNKPVSKPVSKPAITKPALRKPLTSPTGKSPLTKPGAAAAPRPAPSPAPAADGDWETF
ncbi:MAG TPA: methyl-accepting chemotaxis protein [Burkholderiaceae bacterium]|jgi:methyl-accepting chemotaxis protein-1 (serine sensor receptor)